MLARWASIVIIGFYSLEVYGWSDMGHQLVCDIAYENLQPKVKNNLDILLTALPKQHKALISKDAAVDFGDLCTWADKIRSLPEYKSIAAWHYVNVDRIDQSVHRGYCVTGCILAALDQHASMLSARDLSAWARLQALMFLGHWVGDLHQPMHVSFADDRGGNLVRVSGFDACKNLHAVWDYCLLAENKKSRQQLLRVLLNVAEGIKVAGSEQSQKSIDWANESFAIARHPRTRYCQISAAGCQAITSKSLRLSANYWRLNWPVAEHRLAIAGIRLAELLNSLLTGQASSDAVDVISR